jgi:RNA polymerase sigma factor (sigma-70 family)
MSAVKPKGQGSASRLASIAFREYAPRLHAYLMRRMHASADVPDLAMEVYERFLRVKRIDAVENPRAYLFRIASHVVGDARRLEAQNPVAYDSVAVESAANNPELATSDPIAERLDFAQELREVYRAIENLPAMHQAVLLLAVRDGLSHKEVAQRTGLTVSTVKLYVCEARARLRTLLNRQGR